jgi:hypothetical protein
VPLIEIHALPPTREVDVAGILRAVSSEVAAAIPCRLEAVWTTWRTLDGGYAVGKDVAAVQPEADHPPIVHVYANRPRDAIERARDAIESVLCRELSLAEGNVFVTVQPVFAIGDGTHA